MTDKEIRQIVRITIEELTTSKLIKPEYGIIADKIEPIVNAYYAGTYNSDRLGQALAKIKTERYGDTIEYIYKHGYTLEHIAELYQVDVSTVSRNKQRLLRKVYDMLEV